MSDDPPTGPRHTHELLGHGAAKQALLDALNSGRMPHAWILAGPRGIGKATLAYRLTRHLLADAAPSDDMGSGLFLEGPAAPTSGGLYVDPQSIASRQIAAGSHPNLLVVERGVDPKRGVTRGEIVVDDVRKVTQFLRMTASEGRWRIIIVDASDEMNRNAANGLLKLLEEPPARSLLLLVAHAPGRLLPTIRSRCRMLTMQGLADPDLLEVLRGRDVELDPATQDSVLTIAEGSVGRALWLVESDGLAILDTISELLDTLATRGGNDILRLHAVGDDWNKAIKDAPNGERFRVARDLLVWTLTTAIRNSAAGQADARTAGVQAVAAAQRLVQGRGVAEMASRLERVSSLLYRGEALNQERRQMVLDSFSILAA